MENSKTKDSVKFSEEMKLLMLNLAIKSNLNE